MSGATDEVIITTGYGAATAAADGGGSDDTDFTFAVDTTGTFGYASGLSIIGYLEGDAVLSLTNPTPNQAAMGGSAILACTAGDEITVVTSSLADADAGLNAVKGIINIFLGE